jgi:hypothetical protein
MQDCTSAGAAARDEFTLGSFIDGKRAELHAVLGQSAPVFNQVWRASFVVEVQAYDSEGGGYFPIRMPDSLVHNLSSIGSCRLEIFETATAERYAGLRETYPDLFKALEVRLENGEDAAKLMMPREEAAAFVKALSETRMAQIDVIYQVIAPTGMIGSDPASPIVLRSVALGVRVRPDHSDKVIYERRLDAVPAITRIQSIAEAQAKATDL